MSRSTEQLQQPNDAPTGQESKNALRTEPDSGIVFRWLGYTVNGRTYNVPKTEVPNIPKGTADVQEEWLKQQDYVVVKDLANYKRRTPNHADMSRKREQGDGKPQGA